MKDLQKYQSNCARLREIADLAEAEKRDLTDAEKAEVALLERENSILRIRISATNLPANREEKPAKSANLCLREAVENGSRKFQLKFLREDEPTGGKTPTTPSTSDSPTAPIMATSDFEDTGIIAVSEMEMLKPIRTGLIYDKVGLRILSGQSGNTLRWPFHGKAKAFWRAEGERAESTKIDFGALSVKPEGLTAAATVTREAVQDTAGVLESVVREELPLSIIEAVNDAMFSTTTTVENAKGEDVDRVVKGPFVGMTPTSFAGALPTRKELLLMKAGVVTKIGTLDSPCWVMTENMKASLEDVKVDAGSGRFLCENNMILGIPVFTTPVIGEDYIGFGNWSMCAAGFFGGWEMIVDPYTLARNAETDFVLHTRFAIGVLRKEAFALGKIKAS